MEEIIKIKDKKGNKIFKEVHKKEELYKNADKYDIIPDIIVTLNQEYEFRTGYNKKIIETLKVKRGVEGSHEYQRNAVFMAYGPDIKKGKANIEIYDIAPTLLHMYNIPISKEMDGKVLKEIFKKNSEPGKRNVKYKKEKGVINDIKI